jgi:hypothetical protein
MPLDPVGALVPLMPLLPVGALDPLMPFAAEGALDAFGLSAVTGMRRRRSRREADVLDPVGALVPLMPLLPVGAFVPLMPLDPVGALVPLMPLLPVGALVPLMPLLPVGALVPLIPLLAEGALDAFGPLAVTGIRRLRSRSAGMIFTLSSDTVDPTVTCCWWSWTSAEVKHVVPSLMNNTLRAKATAVHFDRSGRKVMVDCLLARALQGV